MRIVSCASAASVYAQAAAVVICHCACECARAWRVVQVQIKIPVCVYNVLQGTRVKAVGLGPRPLVAGGWASYPYDVWCLVRI